MRAELRFITDPPVKTAGNGWNHHFRWCWIDPKLGRMWSRSFTLWAQGEFLDFCGARRVFETEKHKALEQLIMNLMVRGPMTMK